MGYGLNQEIKTNKSCNKLIENKCIYKNEETPSTDGVV
jgi:hypothetical protein